MPKPTRENIVAIIDTREQRPLNLTIPWERGTLSTGDYSIKGLQDSVSYERKSLEDFVACCGLQRRRFMDEMDRLASYRSKGLVFEFTVADIYRGDWLSKIPVASVVGTVASLFERGFPIYFAGSREYAARVVSDTLYFAAKHRFEEQRELQKTEASETLTERIAET